MPFDLLLVLLELITFMISASTGLLHESYSSSTIQTNRHGNPLLFRRLHKNCSPFQYPKTSNDLCHPWYHISPSLSQQLLSSQHSLVLQLSADEIDESDKDNNNDEKNGADDKNGDLLPPAPDSREKKKDHIGHLGGRKKKRKALQKTNDNDNNSKQPALSWWMVPLLLLALWIPKGLFFFGG